MNVFHRALRISTFLLRKNIFHLRTFVLALFLFLLLLGYLEPIRQFAYDEGKRITPFLFPVLSSYSFTQMLFMCGVVLLFCNAPFTDSTYPYLVVRSGLTAWSLGVVFYIALASFLYLTWICLVSVLIVLPNVHWANEWGEVWSTLAVHGENVPYPIAFSFSPSVFYGYEPVKATFLSFVLSWLCCVSLGFILYVGNRLSKKALGLWISGGFIIFDITIYNLFPYRYYKLSPVSLSQLSLYTVDMSNIGISLSYGFTFFVAFVFVMSVFLVCIEVFEKSFKKRVNGGRKEWKHNM